MHRLHTSTPPARPAARCPTALHAHAAQRPPVQRLPPLLRCPHTSGCLRYARPSPPPPSDRIWMASTVSLHPRPTIPTHTTPLQEATIREQRAREALVHQQFRDVMERGEPLVLRPDLYKPARTSSQPHQRPPSPAGAAKGHGHRLRSPAPVAVLEPASEPLPKPSPLSPHQQKQQQRPRGAATRRTSSAAAAPPQAAPRNVYTNSLFSSAGPAAAAAAAASAEKPSSAPRDPQTPPSRASPEALEEYAAQLMRHQLEDQKEAVLRCLFLPQPATPPPPQPARGRSESVHSKPEWRAY